MIVTLPILENFRSGIRALEREIAREMSSQTECCGINVAHCHVVLELETRGALAITDLCDILDLDKSTLSRTIDGMIAVQLVSRIEDTADRRKKMITLSDKGHAMAKAINDQCNMFYTTLFGHLPENKRSVILEAVPLLADTLRAMRKAGKTECDCATREVTDGN